MINMTQYRHDTHNFIFDISHVSDAAHHKERLCSSREVNFLVCLFLFLMYYSFFLSFKMTPHLSKLIKAFKFNTRKRIENSYFSLLFSKSFHQYLRKPTAVQSPPFDVLHHREWKKSDEKIWLLPPKGHSLVIFNIFCVWNKEKWPTWPQIFDYVHKCKLETSEKVCF